MSKSKPEHGSTLRSTPVNNQPLNNQLPNNQPLNNQIPDNQIRHANARYVAALALAAFLLGAALQIRIGSFHPKAVGLLALSLMACVAAVSWSDKKDKLPDIVWQIPLFLGIGVQYLQLISARPAEFLQLTGSNTAEPFFWGMVLCGVLAVAALLLSSRGIYIFLLLLLVHFLLGIWIIRTSPAPPIDVLVVQKEAFNAVLRGANPYAISFPDVYGSNSPIHAPGLVVNGRVMTGYPYLALNLLWTLPAYLLFGDARYAQLLAIAIAAALMAFTGKSRLSIAATLLFLFTPRIFYIVEMGWTDPLIVLCLATTVFYASRNSKFLPYALGLFLATKQFLIFSFIALPALFKAVSPQYNTRRILQSALATAVIVTIPLILFNVPAFIHSVIAVPIATPFRPDALTFLSLYNFLFGLQLPSWLAFIALLPVAVLIHKKAAPTPSGYAASVALIYLTFFAFNRHAFANYYFFVIGALCCALASAAVEGTADQTLKAAVIDEPVQSHNTGNNP